MTILDKLNLCFSIAKTSLFDLSCCKYGAKIFVQTFCSCRISLHKMDPGIIHDKYWSGIEFWYQLWCNKGQKCYWIQKIVHHWRCHWDYITSNEFLPFPVVISMWRVIFTENHVEWLDTCIKNPVSSGNSKFCNCM